MKQLKIFFKLNYIILISISILIISCKSQAEKNLDFSNLSLEFIGRHALDIGTEFESSKFGGISGLEFDSTRNLFYALSDDGNNPRFYELSLNFENSSFSGLLINKVNTILQENGEAIPNGTEGPESIRLAPDASRLYWTSEGNIKKMINSSLREIKLDGTYVDTYPLSEKYSATEDKSRGIQHNKGFESLTFIDEHTVVLAPETALYQDGDQASLETESPVRIIKYDLNTRKSLAEYVYMVSKIPKAPTEDPNWNDNGLSELLAIDEHRLLAIERSFASGVGFTIKLFLLDLSAATDVSQIENLKNNLGSLVPVSKTLIYDFDELGINIGNVEGLTWGPNIDGHRSLIFVTDDNFGFLKGFDANQFFAFVLK